MNKKWKRLLWSLFAAVFTLLVLAVSIPFFFGDRIKEVLIAELNQQLKTELKISPEINVSFLRHFPYASVSFYDARLAGYGDSTGGQKFVEAQELAFYFNPFDVIKGDYTFHSIYLRDGYINVYIDPAGQANYDVIKESPDSLQTNPFLLTIKEAVIENMDISYFAAKDSIRLNTHFDDMHLAGSFAEKDFQVQLNGEGHSISFAGIAFHRAVDWPYNLDLKLDVKGSTGLTTILPSKIELADNIFNASGWYQEAQPDSFAFDLNASGNDVQNLIALLPPAVKTNWEDVEASGNYNLTAHWEGKEGPAEDHLVQLALGLQGATLKHPDVNQPVKSLNVNLSYNKEYEKSFDQGILRLDQLSAQFDGETISGYLAIDGFNKPWLDLGLQGRVNLSACFPYIKQDGLQSLSGKLDFQNLSLQGPLKDLGNPGAGSIKSSGEIIAKSVKVQHLGIVYQLPYADLSFAGKQVTVDSLRFSIPGGDFNFDGSIENLGPYLAQLSGRQEMAGHHLWLQGDLNSKLLDIRMISETFSMNQTGSSSTGTGKKDQLKRIFNIHGNVDLYLSTLQFDSMIFHELTGDLTLKESRIEFAPLDLYTMAGNVTANGSISFWDDNSLNINTNITAKNLKVEEIFRQCGNFGQDALTHKNISGQLNGDVFLIATWRNYAELDEENLYAIANIQIDQGRLQQFEPLVVLSDRFIIDELSDMQFATISNKITVKNKKVSIPTMDIKSDDLALTMGGWHGFDNEIDYTFTIGLKHLLAQKFKKDKPDYREYEVEEGAIQLPIHMFGYMDNPQVELAWKPVGVAIKEELKGEKGEWQQLLGKAEVEKDPKAEEKKHFETGILEEIEFIEEDQNK